MIVPTHIPKDQKIIVFDMDETLVHSQIYQCTSEAHRDVILNRQIYTDGSARSFQKPLPYDYHSYSAEDSCLIIGDIRPNALDVLEYARSKVGTDNVYLMSLGTRDYVEIVNETAKLGFRKDQIWAREDWQYKKETWKECTLDAILIDDLPFQHQQKIPILKLPLVKYIHIPAFIGKGEFEPDEEEAEVEARCNANYKEAITTAIDDHLQVQEPVKVADPHAKRRVNPEDLKVDPVEVFDFIRNYCQIDTLKIYQESLKLLGESAPDHWTHVDVIDTCQRAYDEIRAKRKEAYSSWLARKTESVKVSDETLDSV